MGKYYFMSSDQSMNRTRIADRNGHVCNTAANAVKIAERRLKE